MSKSSYWSTQNNQVFFPRQAAKKTQGLPPGYYSICESQEGIYFFKNDYSTGDIIKFDDDNIMKAVNEISSFWEKREIW